MICTSSGWAQRVAKLRLRRVDRQFVIALAQKAWLHPYRWSAFHSSMRHTADPLSPEQSICLSSKAPDPHAYTSGRWLRDDKLERDSRYIKFDFQALRRKVIELCPGATSIKSFEKKEGGYNRVFVFTCDNERRIVARLPTSVAGPARLTTNSEVATITYLQSKTTVPIPRIIDWSDDSSNAIGTEYIITEHAAGVQLLQKWPEMSGQQQIACIKALFSSVKHISAIEFPAYGSIYFADVALDAALKIPFAPGFCIGPHCGARFWDCNVGEARYSIFAKPNRGPWTDLMAYCNGLIDTGLSRLPAGDNPIFDRQPPYQGSVATHARLLNVGRDVIRKLAEDSRIRDVAAPTLAHADLHKRNIFVSEDDPTIVTDIIDWQSSSIEPAFEYANVTPDFAEPVLDDSPEDGPAKHNANLCGQAYYISLHFLFPKVAAARALDESLLRPFRYCHRTWKDGPVAFRQDLIDISCLWHKLGLAGSSPYQIPTSDEALIHQNEMKSFEIALNLKHKLMSLLNASSDGWIPIELWEESVKLHREVFEELVRTAESSEDPDDPIASEEDVRNIWPFDVE